MDAVFFFPWTLSIAYRFFKHCGCGWRYTGETGIPWAIKLREHRQNLEVGHLVIFRLAQHSFEENHHVLRKEAKSLRLERIQFTGSIRKWPA
jgi:hypothetical protein